MNNKYKNKRLKESHFQLINCLCLILSKLDNNKKIFKSDIRRIEEILNIAEELEND